VGSLGSKMTSEAMVVWAVMRLKGPRWGVEVCLEALLRVGRREVGASGASVLRLDQMPIEPSAEADSMRREGAWTARERMGPRWPYSSKVGFNSAENWSALSVYFHTLIVRSKPADAICVGDRNFAALILDV